MDEKQKLKKISDLFPLARRKFEMEVEVAALEIIELAKQISSAIGEVSVTEAKNAIIKRFGEKLSLGYQIKPGEYK